MPAADLPRARTAAYLDAIDRASPGLVFALYLTGSVALGDFRPGRSDVDMLAVVSQPLAEDDLAALAAVHAALPRDPVLDGVYVLADDLAGPPDDGRAATFVVNGEFHRDAPCGELNPVLWLTLITRGVTVRGPAPDTLGIRVDPDRVREWNRGNLRSYWAPLAAQLHAYAGGVDGSEPVDADIVAWTVLGAPRLHYTIATGRITSKTGAADWVAGRFPDWAELARRCAAWRAGGPMAATVADASSAADLVDAVCAAAAP